MRNVDPGWKEIKRHADFVSLLIKQKRDAPELAHLVGVQPNTVRKWLAVFEDEGLVRKRAEVTGRGNRTITVWEWSA